MFREHDFCGLYMMLAGYAIENLCKGDAVDGLTSEEQIKRRELEEKVASGQLSQSSIVQECWKLTADEREQVKTDGKLPDRLKRHELVAFVTATGLPLTTDEQELLERLKRAVLWFGRYPVPKDYRDRDETRLPDGTRYSTSWIGSTDTYRIKLLIQHLRKHLDAPESYRVTDDLKSKNG